MNHVWIPEGYRSCLGLYDTQKAIGLIKNLFQQKLCLALHLKRVTAPLFVEPSSGLNDDLNGVERPVGFDIPSVGGEGAQVVHSLAKWKRMALYRYDFHPGNGLLTDMNAIRRDEELDNLHSIYVDQWDWEKVITREQRTVSFLKQTVRRIYEAIKVTENRLYVEFPQIVPMLPEEIRFIHAQRLLDLYPDKTPKERENEIVRRYGAVFVMGIGAPLSDGRPHDGRAADYDDWSTPGEDGYPGLNGDILLWNPLLESACEVSSMGIRVDERSLARQLDLRGERDKESLYFHRKLLAGELPCTIGGGIGQSRLCMFLLRKAHIGEIQSSIWPESMRRECSEAGIELV